MKKTKQIAGGFLIILSLFVSSVAACVCSHHAEKVEAEVSSCHEHSEPAPAAPTGQVRQIDSNDDCGCIRPAPRVFSKSETIKIEKQAAVLTFSLAGTKAVLTAVSVENFFFEKPFYLSDSFYNSKSPRAPPAA